MIHEKGHLPNKQQSKLQETVRNSEQTFRNKFKLTQKIQQLSSSFYERALSPWARKRNEPLTKNIPIAEQNNSYTNQNDEPPVQTVRQHSHSMHQANISNFLRKIQFTKRKTSVIDPAFSPETKETYYLSQNLSQKFPNSHHYHNQISDQEKKLIFFPKQAASPQNNSKRQSNESKVKTQKKKQSADTLIATVQNFYDPFQHKSKQQTIYSSIPKGMVNLKIKIKDKFSQNKTSAFINPVKSPAMDTIFRRNSIDETTNRQNLALHQVNTFMAGENNGKIVVNSTQRTFFKTYKKTFSRRSITESTESNFSVMLKKGTHQRSISTDCSDFVALEQSYLSPACQAVRRIKMQQKRSRKVKSEVLETINVGKKDCLKGHNRTQSGKEKTEERAYLYRTFLKYKSKKNSNDCNIIKTLNMAFHSKESFQKNIEKVLQLKPK